MSIQRYTFVALERVSIKSAVSLCAIDSFKVKPSVL